MFPYDYGSEAPETLGTVYVVDDDDAVRDSLKWLLEASDYRVELYDSGESFIAKYDPKALPFSCSTCACRAWSGPGGA